MTDQPRHARERWQAWARRGGRLPFFAWCDALERLEAIRDSTDADAVAERERLLDALAKGARR